MNETKEIDLSNSKNEWLVLKIVVSCMAKEFRFIKHIHQRLNNSNYDGLIKTVAYQFERNNSFYFSWANQQKAGTKIYSLTKCSLTVNERDWHILACNGERINSHCLIRFDNTLLIFISDNHSKKSLSLHWVGHETGLIIGTQIDYGNVYSSSLTTFTSQSSVQW